jgi:kinesin family protein 4/21/27
MAKTEHLHTGTEEREISDSDSWEDLDATRTPLPEDEDDGDHSEMEMLRRLHAEHEVNVAELTKKHEELQSQHEATLMQVEELKQEVAKARDFRPSSPSYTKTYFSRRKSENLMNSDQAAKSITSLKSIADDNLEETSDARQSFQLSLNTVMNELNSRSDKVQALEAELATTRKEMEQKQTIIAGLTRERGSLKASLGVDFSVVQQMREQLLESENQIRSLHEQHSEREKELQGQVESLQSTLVAHMNQLPTPKEDKFSSMPGGFEETPSREIGEDDAMGGASQKAEQQAHDIARLQSELAAWETKHQNATESMKASEARLLDTISSLEDALRQKDVDRSARSLDTEPSSAAAAAAAGLEQERAKHQQIVDALQREVEQYRSTANSHVTKLQELEVAYASISQQVEEDSKSRDLSSRELQTHKNLVANLESQLQVHKSAVTIHQDSLEQLQASHSKELDDLKASMAAAEKLSTDRYSALEKQHKEVTESLQRELTTAQTEKTGLLRSASSALGYETDASKLHSQIKGLVEEGKEIHGRHLKKTNELKAVQEELQNALNNTVELENKIGELKLINEETIASLEKMTDKERKSSRLVDELEEQLNSNFDSHQATTNRLSTMQGEVAQQRINLERELENQKLKNQVLEVCIFSKLPTALTETNDSQQQVEAYKRQSTQSEAVGNFNRDSLSPEAAAIALARSGSSSSQATRKGAPTALPTPPPSIPLPPLPGSPTAISPVPSGMDSRATSPPPLRATSPPNASPPGSRHASNDPTPAISQQLEEQEARIRTIEKHLFAEKQLTATLEEALVDLETSANRTKSESEGWRKKCATLEDELTSLQKERSSSRVSLQAVEEEREMRVRAERARQALEQRMMELNSSKKKKKSSLNCF